MLHGTCNTALYAFACCSGRHGRVARMVTMSNFSAAVPFEGFVDRLVELLFLCLFLLFLSLFLLFLLKKDIVVMGFASTNFISYFFFGIKFTIALKLPPRLVRFLFNACKHNMCLSIYLFT